MKYSVTLTLFCVALLPGAFGQSASVNRIVGMGYLYPPVAVAPDK
jgi:hypothetical protein